MHSNLANKRFVLFSSLLLLGTIFYSADARSQKLRSKITSPLILVLPDEHRPECIVANVGTSEVTVNVILVSLGIEHMFSDSLLPNETFSVDTTLVGPAEFFCKFNYSGNRSEIRAAARVLDVSAAGGTFVPQRAEATEN